MTEIADPGLISKALWFLLVLGILVFVHEWGHYIAARIFRVRIEAFSIGFGRELLGWTDKRGTRWKVAALPLGGYVKFHGDANAASMPDDAAAARMNAEDRLSAFPFKPLWQRAIIVAAGPLINFAFAILIFAALFMAVGQPFTPARVTEVMADSPAQTAGLREGDLIVELDGKRIERFEDVAQIVSINALQPLEIVVERGGQAVPLVVTPRKVEERDRFGNVYEKGLVGLRATGQDVRQHGPVSALHAAGVQTLVLTRTMIETLGQIITGRRSVEELGGPLKIAQYSGQSAALGLIPLITFIALISINLGFVNLLPIPMLDGGHLFLYAVEAVRGRPVPPRVQEWAFMAGFAFVLSLMLLLTFNDLASFGVWDRLSQLLS